MRSKRINELRINITDEEAACLYNGLLSIIAQNRSFTDLTEDEQITLRGIMNLAGSDD